LEKEDSECSEVLVVKAVEAFFIPKVAAIIKGVSLPFAITGMLWVPFNANVNQC